MTEIKTLTNTELAAQCWCDPETSHLVMETALAEAFVKRLDSKQAEIDELRPAWENAEKENTRLKTLLEQAMGAMELSKDTVIAYAEDFHKGHEPVVLDELRAAITAFEKKGIK